MLYSLHREGEEGAYAVNVQTAYSEFQAMEQARSWLESQADHDRYVLVPEDGSRNILMVRTIAGPWYAIPSIGSGR